MSKFLVFLKLIRLPNLIMIVLAQTIAAYKLVAFIDDFQLLLVSFSTIFIAAGGYILNDIEDLEIDKINNKDIISNYFDVKTLKNIYHLFSFIGLAIAFYIALNSKPWFILLFIFAYILLWLYAFYFSKLKLIGNFFISILVAFSITIIPIIANFSKPNILFKNDIYLYVLPSYIALAFFFNIVREIVKDIEDIKGDKILGRITFPIKLGKSISKKIIYSFLLLSLVVIFFQLYFIKIYILLIIFAFILFLVRKLHLAQTKEDFKTASIYIKFIMLFGILYPLCL